MNKDVAVIRFGPQPTLVQLTQVQQFLVVSRWPTHLYLINVHIVYTNRVPTKSPLFAALQNNTHAHKKKTSNHFKKKTPLHHLYSLLLSLVQKKTCSLPHHKHSVFLIFINGKKKIHQNSHGFSSRFVSRSSSPQWAHKLIQLSMKTEDLCIQGGRCQRILASKKSRRGGGFLGVSRCQNSWDSGRFFLECLDVQSPDAKNMLPLLENSLIEFYLFRKVWSIFVWEMFAVSRFTIWRLLVLLNIMLTIPLLTLEENVPDRR